MSEFPVDAKNLSFSDDDEYNDLFITQSTFSEVSTQQEQDALEYIGKLSDDKVGEMVGSECGQLSQKSEEMCSKVYDFSEDHDNGWSVSTQNNPIIVTRNSDGEKFTVGDDKSSDCAVIDCEEKSVLPNINKELDKDLKRFNSIVTAYELEDSKFKRYNFVFLLIVSFIIWLNFFGFIWDFCVVYVDE